MLQPDLAKELAISRGKARWAGVSAAERSQAMRALALKRAAKLSAARRAEIAASGGAATAGNKRRPGGGRKKKT